MSKLAGWSGRILLALLGLFLGPLALLLSGSVDLEADWQRASRARTGLAPEPADTPEAVVQVYGARAFNWRGAFAIHTWVATKPEGAETYTIYQVLGWHARHGGHAVVVAHGYPDREWYGSRPRVLAELRGATATRAIASIESAVRTYPYDRWYRIWPGPNSNTFVAYLARRTPELALDLPPSAIGKDYLGSHVWGPTPSGRGLQISLEGLAGILLSRVEGWELNVLGLGFGIDLDEVAVRLPGIGKLGYRGPDPEPRP